MTEQRAELLLSTAWRNMKANLPPAPAHNGPQKPLPEPNASMKPGGSGTDFTEAEIRGLIANPIYAGVGPFPPVGVR